MPYGTWVPEDELERPQRDALQQAMEAMTPPGLVQQGHMLREHLSGLGTITPAARGASDLLGLFDRLGGIGGRPAGPGAVGPGDVLNPARLAQRAGEALAPGIADAAGRAASDVPGADRLRAGLAELQRPGPAGELLPGLSLEPGDVVNPARLAQGAADIALKGLGRSPLGVRDEDVVAQGRADLAAMSPAGRALFTRGKTEEEAARTLGWGTRLGEAWAGTGLRDVGEDALGAAARAARSGALPEGGPRSAATHPEAYPSGTGVETQGALPGFREPPAPGPRYRPPGATYPGEVAPRPPLRPSGPEPGFLGGAAVDAADEVAGAARSKWGVAADIATSAPLLRPSSLLGNASAGGFRTLQRWLQESGGAAVVDHALIESVADLAGMVRAVPRAVREFAPSFRRGGTPTTQQGLGATGQSLVTQPGRGAQVATAGTRLNVSTDEFWRAVNRGGAEARAAARGLTHPDDVAKLAGDAADFASFAGKSSRLADYLGGFRRVLENPDASPMAKAGAAFMTSLTPYVKTPERVLMATGQLLADPVLLPLSRFAKNDLVRRAMEGNTEAKREVAGRLLVSGLTYAAGITAYVGGQLYGDAPQDPTRRRRMEAAGAQWNTVAGVPTKLLGNFGQAMSGLGTALLDAQIAAEKGADPSDIARTFVGSAGKWAMDESFLRGLSDLAVANEQGRLGTFLEESAVDAVTRPLSGVSGFVDPFDPYERERRGTRDALVGALPGGRFALPTKVDPATGAPLRREGSGVERLLLGSRGVAESPEARELARLGVTAREFKPQDKPYGNVQTPEARRALQETFGRTTRDYIRDTMARPDYKGATEEEQAATLRRQVGLAQQLADIEVGDRVARDPQARFELEWLRTPHYRGVEGTPDRIARQNLEIREAKQLLSEYQQRYGETPGRYRFYDEHPDLIDFARRPEVPERALAEEKEAVRRRTGAPDAGPTGLVGAGNRVVPTPGFTAP
jgi:hypothetical protein